MYVLLALASALPMISAHRYLTGHGQERGGIQVTLQNRHDAPVPIVYYDSIPWFLKLYLHTLDIQVVGDDGNAQHGKSGACMVTYSDHCAYLYVRNRHCRANVISTRC